MGLRQPVETWWNGGGRSGGKQAQASTARSKFERGKKEEYKSTGQVKVKYLQKYVNQDLTARKTHNLKGWERPFFKTEKDDDERLPDFSMSRGKCESIRGCSCLARLYCLLRQCNQALLQGLPGRQSTCSLKQPANGTRRHISSTHLQNEESSTASIFKFCNDAPLYCRFTQACATPDQNHLCLVMRFVSAECAAFFFRQNKSKCHLDTWKVSSWYLHSTTILAAAIILQNSWKKLFISDDVRKPKIALGCWSP